MHVSYIKLMTSFPISLLALSLLLAISSADDFNQWQLVRDEFTRPIDTSAGEDGHNQLPPSHVAPWQLLPPLYPQKTTADGYCTARAFLKAARTACQSHSKHISDPMDAVKRLGHYFQKADRHDAERLTKQLLKFALDAHQAIEQFESNIVEAGIGNSEDSDVAKILKSMFKDKIQRLDGKEITLRDIQNRYNAEKMKEFVVSAGGRSNKLYIDEVNKIVSELLHNFQKDVLGIEEVPVETILKLVAEESPFAPCDFLSLFETEYLRERLEKTSEKYFLSDPKGNNINDYFPLMLSWFFPRVNIIYYSSSLHEWGSDLRDNSSKELGPFVFMYQVASGQHWENLELHPTKNTGSWDEELFNPDMAPHPALVKQPRGGTHPPLLLPAPKETSSEAVSHNRDQAKSKVSEVPKDKATDKKVEDDPMSLLKGGSEDQPRIDDAVRAVHVADLGALRTPPDVGYTKSGLILIFMLFVIIVIAVFSVLQWWQAKNRRANLFLDTTSLRHRRL